LREAYLHCEALVREADKDRFLASLFAPADRRPHLHALYAFNIEIARVGEIVHEALAGEIRLQWWRDALAGEARGDAAANPVAAALMDTVRRCGLPADPLNGLIDARAHDLYDDPFPTMDGLEAHARATSSAIFELAAHILDRDAAAGTVAAPAGVAYALAGWLVALPHHAARGRTHLPLDVLERHGVARDDLYRGTTTPGLPGALGEIAARARDQLRQARRDWGALSREARPAFLPVAVVGAQLARIERNPDPFGRPSTLAPWRRQWLMWRAARRGTV
jgi:phytoene synthase